MGGVPEAAEGTTCTSRIEATRYVPTAIGRRSVPHSASRPESQHRLGRLTRVPGGHLPSDGSDGWQSPDPWGDSTASHRIHGPLTGPARREILLGS